MSENLKAKRVALLKWDVNKWNRYMRFCFNLNLKYVIDLSGVNLQYENLRSAILRNVNLQHADLWGANLRGADLRYTDLRYANLRYADLRESDGIFILRGVCEFVFIAHKTNLQIGNESYPWEYWEEHAKDEMYTYPCDNYDLVYDTYQYARSIAKYKGWI